MMAHPKCLLKSFIIPTFQSLAATPKTEGDITADSAGCAPHNLNVFIYFVIISHCCCHHS